jgi:hypothetical protein
MKAPHTHDGGELFAAAGQSQPAQLIVGEAGMRARTATPVAWARHQRMCSAIWAFPNRCSKFAKTSIRSSNRFKPPPAWMAWSAIPVLAQR